MTDVQILIAEMLTENTGIAMMDSGGENGRQWQRNKGKTVQDFEAEPTVISEVYGDKEIYLDYTISAYHYLVGQLELDEICEKFNELQDSSTEWDCEDFYGVSSEAFEYLDNEFDIGFNGDSWNTYNRETNLSTVLQGCNIEIHGECYVIIQIHGGADVRGGYTDAKLFKLDNEYCYDGGFLNPEDVYGSIDGVQCSNMYGGCNMTTDTDEEQGGEIKLKLDSKVELHLAEY